MDAVNIELAKYYRICLRVWPCTCIVANHVYLTESWGQCFEFVWCFDTID